MNRISKMGDYVGQKDSITHYRKSVIEFFINNSCELDYTVDIDGEISVKIEESNNFVQECRILQEVLMLASPDFEGVLEKVIIKINNNICSITLNPTIAD